MKTTKLLDAVAEVSDGDVVNCQRQGRTSGLFQAQITNSATVVLEGRINPSAPWKTITTFTASDAIAVAIFPQMRARVTVFDSGVVNAWLAE